jgi:hypothetical protein
LLPMMPLAPIINATESPGVSVSFAIKFDFLFNMLPQSDNRHRRPASSDLVLVYRLRYNDDVAAGTHNRL